MVYAPLDEHFAQEVIEECVAFPNGQYDDYVDSMTQAVLRYRQGGFVRAYSDDWDDPPMKLEKSTNVIRVIMRREDPKYVEKRKI